MKTKLPTELPTDSLDESLELLRTITARRTRKVRVEFEYDSELAKAVKFYCMGGEGEEATPAEMRRWFYDRGVQNDEDALESYQLFHEMEDS